MEFFSILYFTIYFLFGLVPASVSLGAIWENLSSIDNTLNIFLYFKILMLHNDVV